MSEDIKPNVSWNKKLEDYFAGTGEKAHCLSWCHKQAEALYSQRRNFIDLPVITISSVVGFLSVGSTSIFQGQEKDASIALGVMSLFVSVLNTVGTYFGWAKRAEAHRISAIQYSKLYRFLSIEMSLPRNERMSPHELLKFTKDGYDRLQEISPLLPPPVIADFKKKFDKYEDISKPEEANGLEKIEVFTESLSINNPLHTSSFSSFASPERTPLPHGSAGASKNPKDLSSVPEELISSGP
jgi:hypothetical protein